MRLSPITTIKIMEMSIISRRFLTLFPALHTLHPLVSCHFRLFAFSWNWLEVNSFSLFCFWLSSIIQNSCSEIPLHWASGSAFFFELIDIPLYEYIIILLSNSLLSCFQFEKLVNKAVINVCVQVLMWIYKKTSEASWKWYQKTVFFWCDNFLKAMPTRDVQQVYVKYVLWNNHVWISQFFFASHSMCLNSIFLKTFWVSLKWVMSVTVLPNSW